MHYLKIHSLEANRWYDRDWIMLHANFQILSDFMEKEAKNSCIDFKHKQNRKWFNEAKEIHKWWKKFLKFQEEDKTWYGYHTCAEYRKLKASGKFFTNCAHITARCEKDDRLVGVEADEMLIRLMKIRQFLWT